MALARRARPRRRRGRLPRRGVLAEATLTRPSAPPLAPVAGKTGRDGTHTEAMGYILAELQSVARANPDATW